MKRVLIALALLCAGQASAYSTGLLRTPKGEFAGRHFAISPVMMADLPANYDSRTEGHIVPIKNQGNCGSCWSFATAGAFEAALIKGGKCTAETCDVAEQDALVNDSSAYGCSGGFMSGRFLTDKGATTEALCPYKASDRYSCKGAKFAKATKWALLGTNSRAPTVDELRAGIVEYGSLFVTVAAGGGFSPRDGVISTCSSRSINHMVQLVAYRQASSGYEFLIKNSWGKGWGDQGYAWSKQGCNKLASAPGDAAGFFYVEGAEPDPQPEPAELDLPYEVIAGRGKEIVLQTRPKTGWTATWKVGANGVVQSSWTVYVMTTTSTVATMTVTDPDGHKTEQAVKVTVK